MVYGLKPRCAKVNRYVEKGSRTMNDENKKASNNSKKLLIIILSIVAVVAIGIVVVYYYKQSKGRDDYNSLRDEVTVKTDAQEQSKTVIPIDFKKLQEKNSDIYAWIEIPDTKVDYPILQSTTDPEDYYLDHTVERTSGLPGSIYTRMTDPKDFSGVNTVIYGHNMKDGSMFKGLHKYEDKSYFDSHPYVTIYTPEKKLTYEIFAAVTYNDNLISLSFDFTQPKGLTDYVESLKNTRNMTDQYKDGVEIKEGDKLITLSTCIAEKPNNRYLVVAVLRNEE